MVIHTSGKQCVWASAQSCLTVLKAKLDISKLKSGHYLLGIRPPGVGLLPVCLQMVVALEGG